MTTIRRLDAEEWEACRDLRLSALADSPDAFGSTYQLESTRADAAWIERVEVGAASPHDLPLIALDGTNFVGLPSERPSPPFRSPPVNNRPGRFYLTAPRTGTRWTCGG